MARYIDADKITDDVICDYLGVRYSSCCSDIKDMIDNQLTIDILEVIHAEWVVSSDVGDLSYYCTCSNCEYTYPSGNRAFGDLVKQVDAFLYSYCPHCGAKMK